MAIYLTNGEFPCCALIVAHTILFVPDTILFSHAANAHGHQDSTLRRHPAYQALGSCTAERQSAYRALFDQVLSNQDINDIRAYIQQQRALGNDRFRAMVERKLGRCASLRPAHRPPAPTKPTDKAL